MDHIVYNAEDVESLLTFYTQVVGLKPERVESFRQGEVPFPSVRINEDTIIDLFPREMWGKHASEAKGRPNLNHFCMAMIQEQWDNLLERLEKNSVDITYGPVKVWGAHGHGVSIYFRDPEGNTIEAKYYVP